MATQTPRLDPFGAERRILARIPDLETRAADEGGAIGFQGHAAVFNERTLIRGWFGEWIESIQPGAFRKTLKDADVRMLINHDPNYVLARNRNGTLRLSEDDIGLLVEADMAPTTYARDLALSLERRDVDQMSFAFRVVKEEWDYDKAPMERVLTELALVDVSVVTYPAYQATDAALRSQAFGSLCRSFGWDDDAQRTYLMQLMTGQVDPDFAPTLEAAGEALRRMARRDEPLVKHSARMELLRRRSQSNLAIATKGNG